MAKRSLFGACAVTCIIASFIGQVSSGQIPDPPPASKDLAPGFNFMKDSEVDRFIDNDGDGLLGVGDTFQKKGFIRELVNSKPGSPFSYNQNPGGGTVAMTFTSSGTVTGGTGTGANPFTLGGVTIEVYDDDTTVDANNPDGANHLNPGSPTTAEITNSGTNPLIYAFGLDNVDDFFTFSTNTDVIASITDLSFQGALTATFQNPEVITLVPFSLGGVVADLAVSGNEDATAPVGVWDVATDSDWIVKGIPEASSMGIWACALLGLSLIVRRRKEE